MLLLSLAGCTADPGLAGPPPRDAAFYDAGPPDAGATIDAAPTPATYANLAALFERSCSFNSCHGGVGAGSARLNFAAARGRGTPYTMLLNGVAACEYSAMPLVDPGHPDNSWLFLKCAGPHMGMVPTFTPSATWDPGLVRRMDGTYPPSECPQTVLGVIDFGTTMPQGTVGLEPADADMVRRWIEAGAPGP